MTGYVALTFDDGPDPRHTAALVQTLRREHARATLFTIGRNARTYPRLLRSAGRAGLWIGNHTWTHPDLTTLTPPRAGAELRRTQALLRKLAGTVPRLFRPPYGATGPAVRAAAARLGLTEVLWDVDSRDWAGATTDEIVASAARLTDGQVLLLHETSPAAIAAVPRILADLRGRGLHPGRICPETGRAVAPQ
ncbi:polysaccharide deacetylase family protein [Dactylosporangium vinaceum]|uniref:Polysaccharide deacetylase family protein n=1 Tax=Dactylosporangium vinaceum TaxID=53362 RepID=A0ABV5MKI6_9ACTN|nr:polysaccharide deacetylase family protein [Dactylosporangium vinaceum]UAB94165.1 polysaccharide deacetylase family protein [Dactylosporangium vinaceum]